jgi:hypothetical protein
LTTIDTGGKALHSQQQDGRESGFLDRGNQPFLYRWSKDGEECYRLEQVTTLPGIFKVPVPPELILARHQLPTAMVVVSERAGGVTQFLEWLQLTPAAKPVPGAPASRGKGGAKQSRDSRWLTFELDGDDGQLDRIEQAEQVSLIVDRTLSSAQSASVRDQLAALAGLIEDRNWWRKGNRLVCLTRDIHELRSDLLYSSLLSRGHSFRLPHFMPSELDGWVEELVAKHRIDVRPKPGGEIRQISQEVRRWVGGQPTLTQFLFRLVDDGLAANPENLKSAFWRQGEFLATHPPHIVFRWREELTHLLEDAGVRRRFEVYTSGDSKPLDSKDFDWPDVALFLAGWVGENAEGSWGIRGKCHERWARLILRGSL